ncbi:MAG TPA: cytochrome D1 domain-containing protein [Piscinibacter sp.]|nr:cytochrome D1 domain-containing protein [Piscinibacter sp.]HOY35024.1 cytochrome D1 domain-containing protein [Piscinibacter sp.]HPG80031.1 cytochrome D1 domain-containing protein [Piscinibacter sp.]HPM67996.1 cytochrome D1 domain-containing protein [Piscinibacter sp.]
MRALLFALVSLLAACAGAPTTPTNPTKGTGDLGVVVERGSGTLAIVDTSERRVLAEVPGLGDLSHASVVFSRDGGSAFVFGRDGALTRVNLSTRRIEQRVQQAGNSIGGAMSQDGTLVAAQNYQPGGIKVFDAKTLALVADIPAEYAPGQRSRVVGLADLPGKRFVFSLFDADQIWIADLNDAARPKLTKFENVGRQPYDALVTPDGRHYIAGLFGEDGLAMIDLWADKPVVRRILAGYGRGQEPLPVFKMPHLRGWAVAGRHAYLPAIGRHEVLVVDTQTWAEVGRIAVAGQPVFVIARPDGRQVWVNFAVPDYDRVQVIDTQTRQIVKTLEPGKAVLHMEFTPRGEAVWISSRDANRVTVIDTSSFATQATLPLAAPSGVFFTSRAARMGF